jgi:isocitrate dehydrogenase
MQPITISVAYGNGIGPEIMAATIRIIEASKANIQFEKVELGEEVYKRGILSGVTPEAWESIRKNKILLKAPITTPQGGGFKSVNVTLRKTLGLFANVRPCQTYHPYIFSAHPGMDLVIIRENEEDLYAGIEHQHTDEVVQCIKLISKPGCEKIVRFAFEYARLYNRKKVTCMTKDNIMKQTDGMFHQIFDEIGKEYPEIEQTHQIIDIGAANISAYPHQFDVIVTLNLYGDIISDIAAQVSGSVGLAGSANIGHDHAMFEAIHGTAPDIAGKNIANPSGLLQAATQMLNYVGCHKEAQDIENAWLKTIEDGIHTRDIFRSGESKELVGTEEFADAVIARLGQSPKHLKTVDYSQAANIKLKPYVRTNSVVKELLGVDIFVDWDKGTPDELAGHLQNLKTDNLQLRMITNRGVKVWPQGMKETFCTDHWRCRFHADNLEVINPGEIVDLLTQAWLYPFDVIKTENLYRFDGKLGFSLGQGQ